MPDLDFRATAVADIAAAVRHRRLSARDLVAHALARIEALNPAVNAFVAVDGERALADAAAIDERIAAGDDVGPLAGIPLAVKDNEDAAGFVTTSGSVTKVGDPPSTRDSAHVARLRAAGCVVLGKTNMPEFGLRGESDNRAFGISRNPWSLAHTPGGSSGGSAAAVTAGMVPLATGSDGGGSIRIPSAVCGLTGLKPSLGRVPAADPSPPGWPNLSTKGPIARRAADVALALDVVVGPHPLDHRSLPLTADVGTWASSLAAGEAARRTPVRVGWSPDLGYATVDREVQSVCRALVDRWADAGAEVVEVGPVFGFDPTAALGTLVQSYIRRTVEPFRGTEWWSQLDPLVIVAAELAGLVAADPVALVRAEDACHTANLELAAALDGVDVLLTPVTKGQTAICERVTSADELLAELGSTAVAGIIEDRALDLERIMAIVEDVRALGSFNLPIGSIDGEPALEWHGMTQAFNMTRTPAGTTFAGFSAAGLPIGIQVVGHQHDDVGVLRAMAALEAVAGDPFVNGGSQLP